MSTASRIPIASCSLSSPSRSPVGGVDSSTSTGTVNSNASSGSNSHIANSHPQTNHQQHHHHRSSHQQSNNRHPGTNSSKSQSAVKCVFVGDRAVGKTSLIVSYTTNGYPTEYVPTAFDTYSVLVTIDSKPCQIQLCDTAGQADFDSIRPLCYGRTDVFLLCFSVVSPASFAALHRKWAPEIRRHCGSSAVPIILVGTQCDLRHDVRVLIELDGLGETPISTRMGRAAANALGAVAYIECSALTQKNLKDVFDSAILTGLKYRARSRHKPVSPKLSVPTPSHGNKVSDARLLGWRKSLTKISAQEALEAECAALSYGSSSSSSSSSGSSSASVASSQASSPRPGNYDTMVRHSPPVWSSHTPTDPSSHQYGSHVRHPLYFQQQQAPQPQPKPQQYEHQAPSYGAPDNLYRRHVTQTSQFQHPKQQQKALTQQYSQHQQSQPLPGQQPAFHTQETQQASSNILKMQHHPHHHHAQHNPSGANQGVNSHPKPAYVYPWQDISVPNTQHYKQRPMLHPPPPSPPYHDPYVSPAVSNTNSSYLCHGHAPKPRCSWAKNIFNFVKNTTSERDSCNEPTEKCSLFNTNDGPAGHKTNLQTTLRSSSFFFLASNNYRKNIQEREPNKTPKKCPATGAVSAAKLTPDSSSALSYKVSPKLSGHVTHDTPVENGHVEMDDSLLHCDNSQPSRASQIFRLMSNSVSELRSRKSFLKKLSFSSYTSSSGSSSEMTTHSGGLTKAERSKLKAKKLQEFDDDDDEDDDDYEEIDFDAASSSGSHRARNRRHIKCLLSCCVPFAK